MMKPIPDTNQNIILDANEKLYDKFSQSQNQ